MPHLFCFGLGYSAQELRKLLPGWRISGTVRDGRTVPGVDAQLFDNAVLDNVTHVLHSIPPDDAGDVVYRTYLPQLRAQKLEWFGYLSTTGVYGDTKGAWVDETAGIAPLTARAKKRAQAEQLWLNSGLPTHIFRLAGIYGPGRSVLEDIQNGGARRIDKPGHVFSRIHVEDITGILAASISRPQPGSLYNCADDLPAEQAEVVAYACELLNMPVLPAVKVEQAVLSEMAKSFYSECRRVDNTKIKKELGVLLRYPTYKEGLSALKDQM